MKAGRGKLTHIFSAAHLNFWNDPKAEATIENLLDP
jgi:hypothetical protein